MALSPRIGALALAALLVGACGGAGQELAPRGAACETGADCREGLVCKGARCLPARSEVGGVCVTDQGCREGLACVNGRCATGPAGEAECARACARIRALAESDLRAAGEEMDPRETATMLDALERDCMTGCVGRLSVEHARCLEQAAGLEAVEACP
ncbi:MAG: DUF7107 domain-containing protein [Myxococcota bacterium]